MVNSSLIGLCSVGHTIYGLASMFIVVVTLYPLGFIGGYGYLRLFILNMFINQNLSKILYTICLTTLVSFCDITYYPLPGHDSVISKCITYVREFVTMLGCSFNNLWE